APGELIRAVGQAAARVADALARNAGDVEVRGGRRGAAGEVVAPVDGGEEEHVREPVRLAPRELLPVDDAGGQARPEVFADRLAGLRGRERDAAADEHAGLRLLVGALEERVRVAEADAGVAEEGLALLRRRVAVGELDLDP